MKKVLTITLAIFTLLGLFSFSAKACDTVTTGDANAYQCVDNQINTSVDFQNWYHDHCVTPTPTVTITPTPTETPTVTITPTPTNTQSNTGGPGDGLSDGRSDGLSSCPSCTQAPATKAVLGLSSTSSGNNGALEIAQLLGALTLSVAGFALYKKNA